MNQEDFLEPFPNGSDHPHRPVPNPATGELLIDPDIVLRAKRFNLQINFFYSSFQGVGTEFGYNRSASTKAYVLSSTSTDVISVVHGDFSVQPHRVVGATGGVTSYISYLQSGCTTTVVFDGTTFKETANDGTQMSYTAQMGVAGDPVTYSLSSVKDSVGNTHTYTYLGGVLQSIKVPGGNTVTFNYSAGLVSSIQDWSGRRWSFTYDANTNLILSQAPIGCITQYSYGQGVDGLLVGSITDPEGYATQYRYDDVGRVVSMQSGTAITSWSYGVPATGWTVQQNPTGALITYGYDSYGNATTVMRPEGYIVTYSYNDQRMQTQTVTPRGVLQNLNYDTNYRLIYDTDPLGKTTQYKYDSYGNVTTIIDGAGQTTVQVWSGATRLNLAHVDPLGRRTTFTYNSDGTLQTQTDPRGLVTTFNYDSFGNVLTVRHPDGGIVTNTYDNLNRLTSATDPVGRTTTLAYDAADNLISSKNPLGQVTSHVYSNCLLVAEVDPLNHRTTYTYGRYNNVTTATDPLGHVTTYNYDAAGRLTGHINPTGDATILSLNAAGQLVSMSDGMGFVTTYTYYGMGCRKTAMDPRGGVTTYTYDARDLISIKDPLGGTTSYYYDALDRLVTVTDPLGNTVQTYYDAAGQHVATKDQNGYLTTFAYDLDSQLTTTTDARGYSWVNVYEGNSTRLAATVDPLGNRTSYTYDFASQRRAIIDALNHRTTYSYDAAGRVVTTMDPKGYVVTQSYDAAGRLVSVMNARGYVTTTGYDAANRPVSHIDALGNVRYTDYDAADRIISQLDPLGYRTTTTYDHRGLVSTSIDQIGKVTTFSYDGNGNRISSQDPNGYFSYVAYDALNRPTTLTDEIGGVTLYGYDAASRRTVVRDAVNNRVTSSYDAVGRVVTEVDQGGYLSTTTYDAMGHVIATTDPRGGISKTGYDAAGRAVTFTTPLGFVTTHVYDAANRNTQIIDPNNAVTTLAYDERDQLTVHTDRLGFATTYSYDANGNGYQTQDPLGNFTTAVFDELDRTRSVKTATNLVTTYQYDANSRQTGIQNPRGYWITTMYSPRGEVTTSIDQSGLVKTHAYDAVGNRTLRKFPTGDATTFAYDGIGNVTTLLYPDGTRVTHQYDVLGRLTTLTDSGGATTYTYNPFSLPAGKRDLGTYAQSYTYDGNQQRTQLTDPDLQTRYTSYDTDGRIASLLTQDGRVITFQYDTVGNRTTELYSTGWKRTIAYDKNDQITGITEIGVGGGVEERWTFTYDAFGNRKTVQDLAGNFTTHTYDNEYRLTQAATAGPLAQTYNYAYDGSGNRTFTDESGTPTTYSYDVSDRLTTSIAGTARTTYSYDANGNLTGVAAGFGLATLTYNYENRLKVHLSPGSIATYTYKANGRDVMRSQQVDGALTTHVWDGDSQLAQYNVPIAGYTSGTISFVRLEVPTPAPNGSVTAFTLAHTPVANTETVFLNGIAQIPTDDYTISGATITMVAAPRSTDQLSVSYFYGSLTGYYRLETPTPATDGTTTVFNLAHTPVTGSAVVYLNGIAQYAGSDYTISGAVLTYLAAPAATDKLRVSYFDSAVGLPSGVTLTTLQAPTPAVDGVTRIFTFSGQSGVETVYLNGVALRPGPGNDYTLSGSIITLAFPPAATDRLLVSAYSGWTAAFGTAIKNYQDLVDGEVKGRVSGGVVNEYGTDALGSVTSSRNGSGAVLNQYRYKPYGEQISTTGSGTPGPFLFVGGAGYDSMGRISVSASMPYRGYDTATGRFTSRDPIGIRGGLNSFEYGASNPTSWTDPLGLDPQTTPNKADLKKQREAAMHRYYAQIRARIRAEALDRANDPRYRKAETWSAYRYFMTGDPYASDVIYEKGLVQANATLENWTGHFVDHNKQALAIIVPVEIAYVPVPKSLGMKIMGRKVVVGPRTLTSLPRVLEERASLKIHLLRQAAKKAGVEANIPKVLLRRKVIYGKIAEKVAISAKWLEKAGEKQIFRLGGGKILGNYAQRAVARNVYVLIIAEAGLAWWAAYDTYHDELLPIDPDDL